MSYDAILTEDIALKCIEDEESVSLADYTSIEEAAARILGERYRGEALDLDGLNDLSAAAAGSLSKYSGGLWLNGLTSLSDAAAEGLSNHEGFLSFFGLKNLSPVAAKSLGMHVGDLALNGLTSLSDAAAKGISTSDDRVDLFDRCLYLDGLVTLSNAAAISLANSSWHLSIEHFDDLSDSAKAILRNHHSFAE
jgi:hypothetical protein